MKLVLCRETMVMMVVLAQGNVGVDGDYAGDGDVDDDDGDAADGYLCALQLLPRKHFFSRRPSRLDSRIVRLDGPWPGL